jgi:uncharacterized membrane protein YdjX (TVP38/TMEM64 family)
MNEPNGAAPRTRGITWLQGTLLVVALAGLVWLGFAAAPWFSRERVEHVVRGAGAWGPAILLGLQVAQILLAPVPGVFVPVLAGILYGPVVGPLLAAGGTALGSAAAFAIGARAGKPLLERWVGRADLEKAHALIGGKRWLALIPLFLVPFSPSDALCFAAGIVGLAPGRFFLAVLVGRLPKDCALALAGSGLIRLGGWFTPG